jgi:hypothetical protein
MDFSGSTNPDFSRSRCRSGCGDSEKGLERPSFHGITALSRRSCGRAEAAFLLTECNQEAFAFTAHFSRRVEAGFTAGQVSSDGGALLLREVARKINLIDRLAGCFSDGRSPLLVQHQLPEMLAQRIFGLALGYEDLNDHEQLHSDPLLALLSGKRDLDEPLAGKSTLNRLELVGRTGRYHKIGYSAPALDRLLGDLFPESHTSRPEQIVLDLDATDIPLYGHQPERFFHGYYDTVVNGNWLAADDGQVDMLAQATSPGPSLLVAPHTPRARMLMPGFGSRAGPNTAVPSEVMEVPPTMLGFSQPR